MKNMRRKINEIDAADPQSISDALYQVEQLCLVNKGYTRGKDSLTNKEVLSKNAKKDGKDIVAVIYIDDKGYVMYDQRENGKSQPNYPRYYATCQELITSKTQKVKFNDEQQKFINDWIRDNQSYVQENPGAEKLQSKEFAQADLYKMNKTLFPKENTFFIYYRTGPNVVTPDDVQNVTQGLEKQGYTFTMPNPMSKERKQGKTAEQLFPTIGLGEFVDKFKGKTVYPVGPLNQKEVAGTLQSIIAGAKANKIDRKLCRDTIKWAYSNAKNGTPTSDVVDSGELLTIKDTISKCARQGTTFLGGIFGIKDELNFLMSRDAGEWSIRERRSPKGGARIPVQQESFDRSLKNIIRENLNYELKKKHKNLLKEETIIKRRFFLISENRNLTTKKQKQKFAKELVSEMVYLHQQGYDKNLIREGFFDMLKGFFSDSFRPIFQYIGEAMTNWLFKQFGIDPNGWIAGTISKLVGNLPIGDIPKLLDCNYLTPLLAKSIAEQGIDRLKNQAGLTGPLADIIRNGVVEALTNSDLSNRLEDSLSSLICDSLSSIKNKVGNLGDQMKQGALSMGSKPTLALGN